MIPVAQAKKDLEYSQGLKDVIDVLKLISSSEFSRLSSGMPRGDILREHIMSCFGLLKSVPENNPFFIERKNIPGAFLLICSDEGFLGEVNTRVVNTALNRGLKENASFIVLGERGEKLFRDSGVECASFPAVKNNIEMDDVVTFSNYLMDLYRKKKIGALHVVYTKFISFTSHQMEVTKLLPCDELLGHIKKAEAPHPDTLVEPDPYHVVEYLAKLHLENNLYNIFWSSKLSEWSIRVMHLEQGSGELKNITEDLRFKYFKSVHALSDKVIREIFAARAVSS